MFKLQSFVRSRRVWMNPARSGRSCPRTEDARIPMLRTCTQCTLELSGTEPPQLDAVEWKVPEDLDISWRFGSKVKTIKTRRDSEWSSLIRNNRHWLRHCWRHYQHRRPESVVSEVGISFRHEGFACQGGGKNRKTKHKTSQNHSDFVNKLGVVILSSSSFVLWCSQASRLWLNRFHGFGSSLVEVQEEQCWHRRQLIFQEFFMVSLLQVELGDKRQTA